MRTIIQDISPTSGGKIVIVVCTSPASALRFSMTYLLQPKGYPNHLGDIEIAPIQPRENSRISSAILCPDDAVICAIGKVVCYFQYAKKHLMESQGKPLSFAQWSKK